MRILVTGAGGFIGYNLCSYLSKKYQVYGIVKKKLIFDKKIEYI